jgi:hypothetical protein
MLGAFAVDRTLMLDTERARLSTPDVMSTHLDLQPAIAAGRAASASSLNLGFHRSRQSRGTASDASLETSALLSTAQIASIKGVVS